MKVLFELENKIEIGLSIEFSKVDDKNPVKSKGSEARISKTPSCIKRDVFFSSMKKILGELYGIAIQEKKLRAGKADKRNRKYKKNAGMILVIGKNESVKISGIEVKKTNELNVSDFASGAPGRLAMFTENAIKDLESLK